MSHQSELERELEQRLAEVENSEAADPSHAAVSGRTMATFLIVVIGIIAIGLIGAAL